ncbi:hypothetical protein SPRG_09925 [Saprolegnia parasitica CBS 223.65]|uniref:DM10 domain-containing protein n=1 Tax=Saprolegnia parasitica (strain CBS 223.65) TaxID=695850 RepID=A0A067C1A1_SAPPC|nr:hypothetical protein SPRG_09925 [Saprolegnia parasitica CBS 223.65]KDO24288.1 hypothetical protein SPRG_09925 [Saprolegnia parasitica CBS 223.65]|eukprot:XP_012205059.1 hypothetical protein SPRG_09925 [Saprolegnia parasitica CBS 223.65]
MARILAGNEDVVPAMRPVAPPPPAREDAPLEPKASSSEPSSRYYSTPSLPTWVTNDRQVLRFYCYFEEPSHYAPLSLEAPSGPSRVRRLVLLYYLSDASIEVSEPRVANSGLAQGRFLARTVLLSPTGGPFTPTDFAVGQTIVLKGHKCKLVDCDAATREYYANVVQRPQPPALPYPDTPAVSAYREIEAVKQPPQPTLPAKKKAAAKVQQFMQFSTHVLRFYCSWEDPHPLYPETRRFTLHYFLADDTVEVREGRAARDRRGSGQSFAVLLSRRYGTPPDDARRDAVCTAIGPALRQRDFVFGRVFHLDDCDEFTRQYYLTQHGITQEPSETVARSSNQRSNDRSPPNDDTDDDDDNGSLLQQLVREKAKKPDRRATTQCLRFRAIFAPTPELPPAQAARSFVLTVHLADETLAIFEPPVPNSGLRGGKFLDRGAYKVLQDDAAARYLRPSDCCVGATLTFALTPKQPFRLVEADEQTLAYCEAHPDGFEHADIERVLAQVASLLHERGTNLRRVCSAESREHGCLGVDGMNSVLRHRLHLHDHLHPHAWLTLTRRFVQPTTTAAEFCDAVVRASAAATPSDGSFWSQLRQVHIPSSPFLREMVTTTRCTIRFRPTSDSRLPASTRRRRGMHPSDCSSAWCRFTSSRRPPDGLWASYMSVDGFVDYHSFFDDVYDCDWSHGNNNDDDEHDEASQNVPRLPPRPPPIDERGPLYIPTYRSQLDTARFGVVPLAANDAHEPNPSTEPALSASMRAVSLATTAGSSNRHHPSLSASSVASRPTSARANASSMTPTEIGSLLSGRFQTTSQRMHAQVTQALTERSTSCAKTPSSSSSSSVASTPRATTAAPLTPEMRAALYTTTAMGVGSGLAKAQHAADATQARSRAILERAKAKFRQQSTTATNVAAMDPTVRTLLGTALDGAKYSLRQALLAHDSDGSGFLREDALMTALRSVQAPLSDDDLYLIASDLFPHSGSVVHYKALLDELFGVAHAGGGTENVSPAS